MTSKFQRMWEESERKVRAYERVADRAADQAILRAALRVINRNGLAGEFVDEICKAPVQPDQP